MAKHMSLRYEDEQLLLHLHDFIYLDKEFISKYIYTSHQNASSTYQRLNALIKGGYIRMFLRQINNSDHRPSNLYTLTRFGVENVEQLRGVVHWRETWSADTPVWWRHQLMIAYTVQEFIQKAGAVGLEVYEWIPEVRAYYEYPAIHSTVKSKTSIRPDGVLVIGPKDSNERMGIFIEMERSYSTKERTIKKIDQFNEFFSRKDELMDAYQRKVAFDNRVNAWTILFIGGTEAKTNKLVRDLAEEKTAIPTLVAYKGDVDQDPFGKIYRDIRQPEEYTTL